MERRASWRRRSATTSPLRVIVSVTPSIDCSVNSSAMGWRARCEAASQPAEKTGSRLRRFIGGLLAHARILGRAGGTPGLRERRQEEPTCERRPPVAAADRGGEATLLIR